MHDKPISPAQYQPQRMLLRLRIPRHRQRCVRRVSVKHVVLDRDHECLPGEHVTVLARAVLVPYQLHLPPCFHGPRWFCSPCGPGTYKPVNGSPACVICPINDCLQGSINPTVCTVGNSSSTSACKFRPQLVSRLRMYRGLPAHHGYDHAGRLAIGGLCPANAYCIGCYVTNPCPASSTSQVQSVNFSACICAAPQYIPASLSCGNCPSNEYYISNTKCCACSASSTSNSGTTNALGCMNLHLQQRHLYN